MVALQDVGHGRSGGARPATRPPPGHEDLLVLHPTHGICAATIVHVKMSAAGPGAWRAGLGKGRGDDFEGQAEGRSVAQAEGGRDGGELGQGGGQGGERTEVRGLAG